MSYIKGGRFHSLALVSCLLLSIIGSLFVPFLAYATESAPTSEETPVTQQVKQGVFGEKLDKPAEGGYIEKQFAKIIARVSDFIVGVLGLKDYSELIFQKEDPDNPLIYYTFDAKTFGIITIFFNSFLNLSAYLCMIAVVLWGITILFKAGTPDAPEGFKTMIRGLVTYFGGLYLGGYLFQLIFFANHVLVRFASEGLKLVTGWDAAQFSMLEIMANSTESLPDALLFLLVIICIGMLNFQYATRLVTLMFLIVIFPAVLYSGLIPGNQKTFDVWLKEFNTQVFTQAGHAIAYALFLSLLASNASFWLLCAFLLGMPTISNLVRLVFGGASAGKAGNALGAGSLLAMGTMMKGGALSGNSTGGSKLSNAASAGGQTIAQGASAVGSSLASALPKISNALTGKGTSSKPPAMPSPMTNGSGVTMSSPGGSRSNQGGVGLRGLGGVVANIGGANSSSNGTQAGSKDGTLGAEKGLEEASATTSTSNQDASNRGGYADLVKGGIRASSKRALSATKAGAKAALTGTAVGAGFIVGSAMTGNVGGGLVGARMGLSGTNMSIKAAQGIGNVGKKAYEKFKDYRQSNPITPASLSADAPNLDLPPGSSAPMLAHPAGPPTASSGSAREAVTTEGGAVANHTPFVPSDVNEAGGSEGQTGPIPFVEGAPPPSAPPTSPDPEEKEFVLPTFLQPRGRVSSLNNENQSPLGTSTAPPVSTGAGNSASVPGPNINVSGASPAPSAENVNQSGIRPSSSTGAAAQGGPAPAPSVGTAAQSQGEIRPTASARTATQGGPTPHPSQSETPESKQGPSAPRGVTSPPNGLNNMTSQKPKPIVVDGASLPLSSTPTIHNE